MTNLTSSSNSNLDELIRKYKSHSLTHDELSELRRAFASMTDKEMETAFQNVDDDNSSPYISDDVEERIISGINSRIVPARTSWLRSRWSLAVAASVGIVMISVIAWLYLRLRHYSQYETMLASATEITTGHEERVSVTLPDGSSVTLGPDSRLSYTLEDFNSDYRRVDAIGELKFLVSKNLDRPFTVISPGLEVKVLGTEFILRADTVDSRAMLYLLTGVVEMSSSVNGTTVLVNPRELAIMDRATGTFTLCRPDNRNDATAMMRGDLTFNKSILSTVIEQISSTYGVRLHLADPEDNSRLFTGYIPSNNLDEALSIIKQSFHFRADISSDSTDIVLHNK